MSSLDWLAAVSEPDVGGPKQDWDTELRFRHGLLTCDEQRVTLRNGFLKRHAIDADQRGTGPSRAMAAPGWLWQKQAGLLPDPDIAAGLQQLLPGSVRIRLKFKLLQPMLSREADSFNLFDNSLRKDAVFRVPHLGPQTIKGLVADAYQRAFPSEAWPQPRKWSDLGTSDSDPERTRSYRMEDRFAARLFGTATDTNAGHEDGIHTVKEGGLTVGTSVSDLDCDGRLHFSPVWFEKVQFVIMNPVDRRTSRGGIPIQFETIAPGQQAEMEFVYHNPYGLPDSEVSLVRSDLCRMLWAVAHWWPQLGLGSKRLAGYGGIEPVAAGIASFDWPDLPGQVFKKVFEAKPGQCPWKALAGWLAEELDES